jgi:hypothetical protein
MPWCGEMNSKEKEPPKCKADFSQCCSECGSRGCSPDTRSSGLAQCGQYVTFYKGCGALICSGCCFSRSRSEDVHGLALCLPCSKHASELKSTTARLSELKIAGKYPPF